MELRTEPSSFIKVHVLSIVIESKEWKDLSCIRAKHFCFQLINLNVGGKGVKQTFCITTYGYLYFGVIMPIYFERVQTGHI